jgi:PAS domain S-box-containing protein
MIEPSDSSFDTSQREQVERELIRQRAYLDELFELAPDAVALTTLSNLRILRINRAFTRVFGYTSEEAVGNSLRNLVVPDAFEPTLPDDPDLVAGRKVELEGIRRRKDGTRFHAHITGQRIHLSDVEDAAYFVFTNVSARTEAEAVFAGEKRLLEIIAARVPLTTTLETICCLAEDVDRSLLTSILLLDCKRMQLRHGASPRLSPSYVDALDGTSVGLGSGPCAAAAHLGEQVISLDLAADERWSGETRALASAHGLRTCWSTPIMSSDGAVLGTFAVYPGESVSPTPEQRSGIDRVTRHRIAPSAKNTRYSASRSPDFRAALIAARTFGQSSGWIAFFSLPILLVSGYLSPAVIERAQDAGATEVLKKPLPARQLQLALDRVLPPTSGPSTNESSKRSRRAATPRRNDGPPRRR